MKQIHLYKNRGIINAGKDDPGAQTYLHELEFKGNTTGLSMQGRKK